MASKVQKLGTFFSFLASTSFLDSRKRNVIKVTIFLTIVLVTTVFSLRNKAAKSNLDNLSLFLENVMIREGGLYTLAGSKPITLFRVYPEISNFPPENISSNLSGVSQKEVENSFQYLSELKHLKHDRLWKAWTQANLSLNSKTYMLTTRLSKCSERPMGIFINIPNVIYTLSSNYELFEKETGQPFNPENILEEIGSNSSQFWECVFENHYLLGILLGYGKLNAFIFNWMVKSSFDSQNIPIRKRNEDHSRANSVRYSKKINVQSLPLPQFDYFNIYSEDLEKYKKERSLIVNEFKGKHFESKVLEYLAIPLSCLPP